MQPSTINATGPAPPTELHRITDLLHHTLLWKQNRLYARAHCNTAEVHENGTQYWRSSMSQRRHLSICCLFVEGLSLTGRIHKTGKMQKSWRGWETKSASEIIKCSWVIMNCYLHLDLARIVLTGCVDLRDKEDDLQGSAWPSRSESDCHCQENTGVWQDAEIQAHVILKCGASGLTAGGQNHTGSKESVRGRTERQRSEMLVIGLQITTLNHN